MRHFWQIGITYQFILTSDQTTYFYIVYMPAQITWGYSFVLTSNWKHIYSYPLSPGEILIDCTSKSNEKCTVVSGKFNLRLLIWQIEEIDVRKLRIWGLSISGVFIFWSNESQRLEMTKLIPKCLFGFMFVWAFGKSLDQKQYALYEFPSLVCF